METRGKEAPSSNAQVHIDIRPQLPTEYTSSVPGFLHVQRTAPTSRVLDIKFYTSPSTPPPENEIFPYKLDENLKDFSEAQDARMSSLMKELTHGYETRNKWARYSHLKAANKERRAPNNLKQLIKSTGPNVPKCEHPTDLQFENIESEFSFGSWDGNNNNQNEAPAQGSVGSNQDDFWSTIFDCSATSVSQSTFIHALENEIQDEIKRCACPAPNYETAQLYEDLREGHVSMESIIEEPEMDVEEYVSIKDSMTEPEEKLMARLKIYRRALSSIILHFKNLRPILRAIKLNYDGLLGLTERQMGDLKLLQNNIGYTQRHFDVRLAQIRTDGYRQLCEAEKRCFLLLRHVDKQDAAMRTMTEILNSLENCLEGEKVSKVTSEEKRKKLVMEINDLRRQVTENARILGQEAAEEAVHADETVGASADDDVSTVTDASAIRNVLENARSKLSEIQKRLTILEADYSDVIPKPEHEALKHIVDDATNSYNVDNEEFETISSQVQNLKDQVDSLTADRDDFQELVADLQFKATPRPSWGKIAEFVEGGLPRWQEIYQGKSSKEIVDQVVEVLTGKKVKGATPEWIPPLGTVESVPPYLRYDSPVRQRYFTRRDVAVLIQDIQHSRIKQLEMVKKLRDAQESDDNYGSGAESSITILPFPLYFASYFEERFPWPSLRAEYVYNMISTCQKMVSDRQLKTFLGILEGRMDEALLHGLRTDFAKVRNVLMEKSTAGGHAMGSLPASEFSGAMREAFPQKSEEKIKLLEKAAAKQTGAVADWFLMKYVSFFVMTDEGLVGEFVEELVRQYHEDRTEYVYEILQILLSELGVSLQSAERENDPAGETDVTMPQIYNAITAVDPQIPEEKIAAALSWIFMAESSLPGLPVKGMILVRYIQDQIQKNKDADSDDEDDNDLAEFERAIDEIRTRNDDSMLDDAGDEKTKRDALKKLKVLPLRVILERLKGGCLFRQGEKPGLEESDKGARASAAGNKVGAGKASISNNVNRKSDAKKRPSTIGVPKEPNKAAKTSVAK